MRIRLADYIAEFLSENGIQHVFTVTGGGAMHLNDALGKHQKLKCIYNHHEQACAMAAESYARLTNRIAAVCVTTGPGGTNAITGVWGGHVDSIPMLIISGQVRYNNTIRSTGKPMRQLGDQEVDIITCVQSMTKYAYMVTDPREIRYQLEKALYLAKEGRGGPCWLDIPGDVQSSIIDTELLIGFNPDGYDKPGIDRNTVKIAIDKLLKAKKPVVFAGSGIRLSGAHDEFLKLIDKLNIPVVSAWNAHDVICNDNRLFSGRPGSMGDRAGNIVVQNSDFLLILGCRLNIRQISYNYTEFARDAYKVMVDIDYQELLKPTLNIDMPIYGDVGQFISLCNEEIGQANHEHEKWLNWCRNIDLPVVMKEYYAKEAPVNPYCFLNELFDILQEDQIVVTSNGSACVCTFQAACIKKGQRLYTNSGCASMGYGLPASIGAAIASGEEIICLEGDGSLQMNIQELQTVIHYQLPIKIFVINNDGYHSIRQTQRSFFGTPFVGINPESGISFPQLEKIAGAYGFPYFKIDKLSDMNSKIQQATLSKGPFLCEVVVDPEQNFAPKLASKILDDGTMYTPPLDDMAPFLPKEVLEEYRYKG